jgi:hypothetical protein
LVEGEGEVAEVPVEPLLVVDGEDVGDPLGPVGLVSVLERAFEEDVAGEEGFGDEGLSLAVVTDLLDDGQVAGDVHARQLIREGLFLAALGVQDVPEKVSLGRKCGPEFS